jgi:iron complex outermembrane receptor protein
MGGKVRLSGDVVYSDYKDFQAHVGGGTVGATGVFPVVNAGKLTIWGIEFEAAVRPVPQWNLRVAAGYLNAKYDEFNDGRRVPPSSFSCNPTDLPAGLRAAADADVGR